MKPLAPRDEPPATGAMVIEQQKAISPEANPAVPLAAEPNASVRAVQYEQRQWSDDAPAPLHFQHTEQARQERVSPESLQDTNHGTFTSRTELSPSAPSSESGVEQVHAATHRMPMDDSASSSDTEEIPTTLTNHKMSGPADVGSQGPRERLSESPVQVVSQDLPHSKTPPPLMIDTSSQEDPSVSPVSLPSSPELLEAPRAGSAREATPASTAQSSRGTPTWSDASLRAYLEDDTDIRDLLIVVHDKSDVKPAGADHPLVKDLFKEENRKLGELSTQLDGLLGDLLDRKSRMPQNKQP